METKMITIPFDVDRAKRIQAGEEPGKIVTRDGKDVRIISWERKTEYKYKIVGLVDQGTYEDVDLFSEKNGSQNERCICLHVPEWAQFEDGDVIYCETTDGRGDRYIWLAVMKELHSQVSDGINIDFYFSVDIEGKCKGETGFDGLDHIADSIRLATEEEKQQLIDALKQSSASRAKEYLKRFFGIEEKPEYKFEPFDKVLVRFGDGCPWEASFFSHIEDDEDEPFNTVGGIGYEQCIPYNEQTKHLLGTKDSWEG